MLKLLGECPLWGDLALSVTTVVRNRAASGFGGQTTADLVATDI